MRSYPYLVVDVFTTTRLEGNALAVLPSADGITDAEMQRIAAEFNLSETVFLLEPASAALARVRIFTPRRELDFAGHPTVGSAYVVTRRRPGDEPFVLDENVGPIAIEIDTDASGNRRFWLTTPRLTFFETVDPALCAQLLNLSVDALAPIAPQYVSAGSPFLFVCLRSPEDVDRAELQAAHVPDVIGSANAVGTFFFARKEPNSSSCFDVYSRMFAPQTGIAEDPATGGATGPLAGYMRANGLLPSGDAAFVSEQGVRMGRRSLLHVRVEAGGEEPTIKVGGCVVPVAEGVIQLDG